MSKSKFWCFTKNSNADSFHGRLETIWSAVEEDVCYICGQLEVASTGQRHFQGYIQLKVSRAISWVKNHISNTAHFESQKGTATQAREYCKKVDETTVADSFVEFGRFVAGRAKAGARNDLHDFKEAIKSGATQRELIESHTETFARNIRFHDRVRSLYANKRKREEGDDIKVILYVGDPGSGKTRKAFDENEDLFELPISNGTLWFDGYDMHQTVLFDDFTGAASALKLDNALKLFDRYARQVPVKGGHVWYAPKKIIVTSNFHPRCWYGWKGREDHWGALTRRFHEVWVFHLDEEPELQPSVEEYFNDHDHWPQMDVNGNIVIE